MNSVKQFLDRWKTDYNFKTFMGASGSLIVTAVFALFNGFLGIYHASLWHGAICAYYLILVLLRGMIITAAKRISLQEKQKSARNIVCLKASVLLLILNISLVRLLRTINFVDALVSILTLQNTLIMVHSNGENAKMLPLTAMTSAAAWMAVLFLSISSILNAIRRIRFQK